MSSSNTILYLKDHYISDDKFIISKYLTEYDISKANINILYSMGAITQKQYNIYYNMDKQLREESIGKLKFDKSKDYMKILSDGFKYYRKLFVEANSISIDDVQAIRKDSYFLINKEPLVLKFDNVEFKKKGTYMSYYRVMNNKYEIYHNIDDLVIKGVNDESLIKCKDFLNALNYIFNSAEEDIHLGYKYLLDFYEKYVNLQLPSVYYRELNINAKFMFNGRRYSTETVNLEELKHVDISCNRSILNDIYGFYINRIF